MLPQMLMRQLDVLPIEMLSERINVIGAGAIGSFVTLSLAKMGFSNITVYDDDVIETENMNCQFYPLPEIGNSKVEALRKVVEIFTGTKIEWVNKKYTGGALPGTVISAVDKMSVRKLIWSESLLHPETTLIIDPRMSAEDAALYCYSPLLENDRLCYEKTLYSDEEAVVERCTAKATMYTVLLLSGLVCKAVKDKVMNKKPTKLVLWNVGENKVMGL